MTYSEFLEKVMMALYQESQESLDVVPFHTLVDRYGLEARSGWLTAAKDDLQAQGFITGPRHLEIDDTALGRITGAGLRYVEHKYGGKDGVGIILDPIEAASTDQTLPEGIAQISGGRAFLTSDATWKPSDPRPGDIIYSYESQPQLPASDRLVSLDHNSAPYKQVREGLAELHEELRTANDLDCSAEERERLLASLSAAQKLWESAQLKIIQIKVGIIITVEDSVSLLAKAGKAVGKALLIDVIKSIVKHKTGIDL